MILRGKAICIVILFLQLFIFEEVKAQSIISGTLSDGVRGLPLTGVHIRVEGHSRIFHTDDAGKFEITIEKSAPITLTFSHTGFKTQTVTIEKDDQKMRDLKIVLSPEIGTIDPIVIEGSSITGGMQQVRQQPGSAHYISPLQLKKFAYTDINLALRQVPGINLQEEDGFGLRPNIGLRGTGVERSSKITVMEDGVLMAPAPYSAPAAYYFPTIGRMHAVEVLKGSSQIKYGPHTTGGAINLVSTPIPEKLHAYAHIAAGSFNSREVHAHSGNHHKHFAYMVETFQYSSEGFKDLDNGGETGFNKEDYLFKFQLHNKAGSDVRHKLLMKAGITKERSDETYLGLNDADFESNPFRRYSASQKDQMNTDQNQQSLTYTIEVRENLKVRSTVYRNNFKRNWYKLDSFTDSSGTKTGIADALEDPSVELYPVLTGSDPASIYDLNVKANNRSYTSYGAQTNISYHFNTGVLKHRVYAGFRMHYDEADRFQWTDDYHINNGTMFLVKSGVPGTESNRLESTDAIATFLQYKLNYGKWTFTPGLRNEQISLNRKDYGKSDPVRNGIDLNKRSNSSSVWIPGLSIDLDLNETYYLFTGVHKGFSPAGSAKDSRPEESINYETGIRKNTGSLTGQLVLFYNDYSNLLGADLAAGGGGGTGEQYNAGEVETKGIEFQLEKQWLLDKGLLGTLSSSLVYTFIDGNFSNSFASDFEGWNDVEKGDDLPYMSKNQLTIFLGYLYRDFSINFSLRYQDPMRTVAGHGSIPDELEIKSQLVADAAAEYKFDSNFSVFATVNNISDEVYAVARRPAGLRPGLPRFFKLGLRVNIY